MNVFSTLCSYVIASSLAGVGFIKGGYSLTLLDQNADKKSPFPIHLLSKPLLYVTYIMQLTG